MKWSATKSALIALALGISALAQAAEVFPSRPVRIVVPASPGGLNDIVIRMLAQKMGETLGQPVVVENRPGADTMLGNRFVKSAPADGYTLLSASGTLLSQTLVKKDPGYDLKDFAAIGSFVRSPWVMLVGPSQPDKNLADFIARAKARPEQMSFASGGVGTTPYLAEQMLLQRAGVELLHVPYKGIAAAIPDVVGGRVTMVFDAIGSSAGHVRSGQLRALGVTSAKRLPILPDVPTIAEQGMPGYTSYVTIGLLAPAGTPREIVNKIAAALKTATESKELRDRVTENGAELVIESPEEFTASLNRELAEFAKLVTSLRLAKE